MRFSFRSNIGILFLFIGALILLQNLSIFNGNIRNVIAGGLYVLVSIYLFTQYSKGKDQWWWLILGGSLLGLGISNLVKLIPNIAQFSPLLAVTGAGLGFLMIYLIDRINWWALIPGGLLVSLGMIQYIELTNPGSSTEGVLFLGLGLSFLVLFLIPTKIGRMSWPLLPAIILFAIGAALSFNDNLKIVSFLGPGFLLLTGILVLFFSNRNKM